jgi:guanylate kinase
MNIVISGPGGVGKGTVVRGLMAADDRLWLSRSWTTRAQRPGEDPAAYHFVSEAEFSAGIEAGRFLEWVAFLDYRQGTPVPDLPPGMDAVFELDVHGAEAILGWDPDALSIFIDTPSRDVQRERLEGRGDDAAHVEKRLRKGDEERVHAAAIGAITVINDDLDRCVADIEDLIEAQRRR